MRKTLIVLVALLLGGLAACSSPAPAKKVTPVVTLAESSIDLDDRDPSEIADRE